MLKKIRRNDACPCGSGKKYKKCCGTGLPFHAYSDPELDNFRFIKEMAYKGNIGRAREAFCTRYIDNKQSVTKAMEEAQLKEVKANGETITCHKGCTYCCYQHISTFLEESEAIVYYLYQHEQLLYDFLGKYPSWREEVRRNEPLFQRVNYTYNDVIADRSSEEKRKALMDAAEKYLKLQIPCPFLKEGSCSIYAVRPWPCASLVATTSPEWCSPTDKNKPKVYLSHSWESMLRIPFYRSIDSIVSTMPIAVFNILQGGFHYLSVFLGLEGLEKEFLADHEVRQFLRGNL